MRMFGYWKREGDHKRMYCQMNKKSDHIPGLSHNTQMGHNRAPNVKSWSNLGFKIVRLQVRKSWLRIPLWNSKDRVLEVIHLLHSNLQFRYFVLREEMPLGWDFMDHVTRIFIFLWYIPSFFGFIQFHCSYCVVCKEGQCRVIAMSMASGASLGSNSVSATLWPW